MSSYIDVTCNRCKLYQLCPKKGNSPIRFQNHLIPCQLVGGYGRKPIVESKVSTKNLKLYKENGPCITFVQIPYINELGNLDSDLIKIFHQPILHDREKTEENLVIRLDNHGN